MSEQRRLYSKNYHGIFQLGNIEVLNFVSSCLIRAIYILGTEMYY